MIKMRGLANGSFTDVTGCSVFSPAQPQFLPLPVYFGKRIPTQFCTFTVLRPSRIFYPNGRPQVRNFSVHFLSFSPCLSSSFRRSLLVFFFLVFDQGRNQRGTVPLENIQTLEWLLRKTPTFSPHSPLTTYRAWEVCLENFYGPALSPPPKFISGYAPVFVYKWWEA